ncbi:unnamed protein product [Durusdinium trenchii]|uniref:Pentatricopeptide repeat-containing protein, chloroplastic n=1 Tax=Durusdinium trenchii TaxID=1381693 RepID=A0ABP0NC74_9DINO
MKWFYALHLVSHLFPHGLRPDPMLRTALVALSRRASWIWAVDSLQALQSLHACWTIAPSFLNSILSALDKAARWRLALDSVGWMTLRQIKLDACSFNTVLSACRRQDWIRGSSLLAIFATRSTRIDMVTCSTAISSYADATQWRKATFCMFSMQQKALQGNDVARSAAVHSCRADASWQRAMSLAGALQLSAGYRAVINALMAKCQKHNSWELSAFFLSQLEDTKPMSYTIVMGASPWTFTLRLLHRMRDVSVLVDPVSANAATSALEEGSAWRGSLSLIKGAHFTRLLLGTPAEAVRISAVSHSGLWQAALENRGNMVIATVATQVICNAMVAACERGRSWKWSVAVVRTMPALAMSTDEIGYNSAITACWRARQWPEALYLVQALERSNGLDLASCLLALVALEAAGKWKLVAGCSEAVGQTLFGMWSSRELNPSRLDRRSPDVV